MVIIIRLFNAPSSTNVYGCDGNNNLIIRRNNIIIESIVNFFNCILFASENLQEFSK